jgi:hypothetical protein
MYVVIVWMLVFLWYSVIVGILFLAFILYSMSRADAAQPQIKTPPDCVKLAAKYAPGTPIQTTYTRAEAQRVLAELGWKMIGIPEARACRAAIIRELKRQP